MEHIGTKQLETSRLILRKYQVSDAINMYNNWASNENVTKYMTWCPHKNVDVTKELIAKWISGYNELNNYHWVIELKSIHEVIGSISVVYINEYTKRVTVGYCIGEAWWNQGIMSEALQEVIRFLFEEVKVSCVCAEHVIENKASGKVMQKAGMKYEGIIKKMGLRNTKEVCDLVSYSITEEEYFNKKSIWNILYEKACLVLNPKIVSPFVEAGGVACSIETINGNIYVGVCFDTCSGLGMCAERNAIANMLTHGEHIIKRIVAVMSDYNVGSPCGACRELIMQLAKENKNTEILVDLKTQKTITLEELLPDWWGVERYNK